MPRQVNLIVAVDIQGGFAKQGKIPWNIPEDMKHFKQTTDGHICLMGRKTYQDIIDMRGDKVNNDILPNRKCYVLSNTLQEVQGGIVVKEFNEIEFTTTRDDINKQIFVIGGQKLYEQYIARADMVIMTIINNDYQCDQFFPVDYLAKYFSPITTTPCDTNKNIMFVTYRHNKYNI